MPLKKLMIRGTSFLLADDVTVRVEREIIIRSIKFAGVFPMIERGSQFLTFVMKILRNCLNSLPLVS